MSASLARRRLYYDLRRRRWRSETDEQPGEIPPPGEAADSEDVPPNRRSDVPKDRTFSACSDLTDQGTGILQCSCGIAL